MLISSGIEISYALAGEAHQDEWKAASHGGKRRYGYTNLNLYIQSKKIAEAGKDVAPLPHYRAAERKKD
ncbi:hypothetical protein HNY73_015227 [Argiope bruennichi]|uniref:Uncharacterized protein n=1 Tax=Argiope bruennichi TaxID=94029 RepID=A0A8T0ERF8_ARGBR|nr:hypothetical protein HNY73_015227 [Argiope bruennichi]